MTATPQIRAAIIGLGKMGRLRTRKLLQRGDVEVCCGYDPEPASCRAEFPNLPCLASPEEIFAPGVDVVWVCTPNAVTPGMVIAALEAGKHVFCEKPPGRTVADIQRIRDAEARHPGQKLAFGFNHRFHAGIQEAHRMATSGRLGEILWIRGVYGKAGGAEDWRGDPALAGGGILLDQGIHLLDLCAMFLGDFVEVKSMIANTQGAEGIEDNAFALLRDTRGRIAQIHSSSTQWKHRFNFEIYLSGGYLSVNGILTSTRSYGDETLTVARRPMRSGPPTEETIFFDEDPSWATEIDAFLRCVREGTPVISGSSLQALRAMELVHKIYRGNETFTMTE
jgi:predicted dehydrogenase